MTSNNKILLALFFCFFWLAISVPTNAQQGFYIPQQGKIYFAGDSSTIFSNVNNHGNFGIGNKAFINFKGTVWENDPASTITDETSGTTGIGGWIRFIGNNNMQRIIGGYNAATKSGPLFPHLQLQNSFGVELFNSSIKVKNEFNFNSGHVYLNGQTFVLGHNGPGKLSGFNESRYFVTNTLPSGSILLRENITQADGKVIFPIGSKINSYTPAAVKSKSLQGDDYFATVFDGVRTGLFTGTSMLNESVNKTWQLGKIQRPGQDEVEIFLQHMNADEGSLFQSRKQFSFISSFAIKWDTAYPQIYPVAGNLTTGNTLNASGVNNRALNSLSVNSYFTKFTGFGDSTLKTKLLLSAYRIDHKKVNVNWQTKPEVNVKYYVVQRKLSNEANFKNIDTVASTAVNGLSLQYLNYGILDTNSYRGISFYRLKVHDYGNAFYYSNIVAVNLSRFSYVLLWPNPNSGKFNIIINSHLAKSVAVFNNLGQKVWQANVPTQMVVNMDLSHLPSSTYYLSAIGFDGKILETQKLVIVK